MLSLKKLIYIPLIFLFLPAFCIPAGALSSFFPVYNLALILLFFILVIFNIKYIINSAYALFKRTPFKYFVYFILWCIITDLFLMISGRLSISRTLYSILVIIIGYYILYSLYPAILMKYINIKKIYKIIIFAMWLILIWGIISFIGIKFDITPIKAIESFICNKHTLQLGIKEDLITRNKSVFTEPGFYGYFLNTNLWFIYNIPGTKYKIFKNNYLNTIIKYSIVPLIMINIITTFSPITIVIALIITTIYLLQNKSIFKKGLVIFIMLFAFVVYNIPSVQESKPITRIQNTISSFTDFDKFAAVEQSLYTRVCSYINTFVLFLKHPIIGVGSGMPKYYMAEQFQKSPIPLSAENTYKMSVAKQGDVVGFNLAILYTILAETGIVGFILLYTYFINTIFSLKKTLKTFKNAEWEFINSIIPTMWLMIILSVYESLLINSPYIFLIFIVANSIYLVSQKRRFIKG